MNNPLSEKDILNEVILGYRKVINDRYKYDNLTKKYTIPASFTRQRIDRFRTYFLNNIYPDPHKREELDDAFASLDNYIRHPGKLLRLLMESGRLLFKYGRHLPKILRAGLRAFSSFRAATEFERKLVSKAMISDLNPPYDSAAINILIKELPLRDIEHFIEQNQALFETLYDRTLISKIKEIVEHLISRMRKQPNIYSAAEVRGMEIGRDIIKEGDFLFEQLTEREQRQIFDFVIKIERGVLEEIHAEGLG